MLYKSSGHCSFREEDFWEWPFENLFVDPVTYICNQSEPLNIFVEDHPGTIPVEFGQIPISGSREKVVWSFPYIIQCEIVNPRAKLNFTPRDISWTTLVEDLQVMLYTKYESSGPCSCRPEDFWKYHFKNLFLTPWPTYETKQNHLNNFVKGLPRDHSCWVWSNSH